MYLQAHFKKLCQTWETFLLKPTPSHRGFFWFYWIIIFLEKSLQCVWGRKKETKKSCSCLLLSLGPDCLFEAAKNHLMPIFHVLKFTACQTASCQWYQGAETSAEIFTVKNCPCYASFSSHTLLSCCLRGNWYGNIYICSTLKGQQPWCGMVAVQNKAVSFMDEICQILSRFCSWARLKIRKGDDPFKIKMELLAGRKGTTQCS